MFDISIDNVVFKADPALTLLQNAEHAGIIIPSLCYDQNFVHRGGCMVCALYDTRKGSFVPSCLAKPEPQGVYEHQTLRVREFRRAALSLLLSEHHGDCVAPCVRACPVSYPIPRALEEVREGKPLSAGRPPCAPCDHRCEKACRRRQLDSPVGIADILLNAHSQKVFESSVSEPSAYGHIEPLPGEANLLKMAESSTGSDSCLSCHCLAETDCRLRKLSTLYGAKTVPRSAAFTYERIRAAGIVFEPGKCVRCGICAAVTETYADADGIILTGRGSRTLPAPPYTVDFETAFKRHGACYAEHCPTGAIRKEGL